MRKYGATAIVRRIAWLTGAICVLIVQGCNAPVEQTQEAVQPPPQAPGIPLNVSINAVMVGMVDHASHEIWNAATKEKAPKTDKDWYDLQHHAIQVAAAGSLIMLPGTGKADAAWVDKPEWKTYAQELADAGAAALDAATSKNAQALSEAGDKLVNSCEGCHKVYKGDLPSEGIVHEH
jgi:hypothetical protein